MKKTIIAVSLIASSLCASEGPNDKKPMPSASVINPVTKPVFDAMKRDCENRFVCWAGLSAYRSSVMLAADLAKAPTIYEFLLQEPHPRTTQRSSHHNQDNK